MADENQESTEVESVEGAANPEQAAAPTEGGEPAAEGEAGGEGAPAEEAPPEPAEITLSMIEFKALQEKIQQLGNEVADNRDKYLRSLAEFENYKKRVLKERSELMKYQGEKVLQDILEILDNLDLAKSHENSDPAKLKAGLELIHKRFVDILGKWEVRGESAIGKDFDPNIHNAISRIKLDDAKPGAIIGELKKTYFYKDKLLRVGEVVVADGEIPAETKAPPAEEAVEAEESNGH